MKSYLGGEDDSDDVKDDGTSDYMAELRDKMKMASNPDLQGPKLGMGEVTDVDKKYLSPMTGAVAGTIGPVDSAKTAALRSMMNSVAEHPKFTQDMMEAGTQSLGRSISNQERFAEQLKAAKLKRLQDYINGSR